MNKSYEYTTYNIETEMNLHDNKSLAEMFGDKPCFICDGKDIDENTVTNNINELVKWAKHIPGAIINLVKLPEGCEPPGAPDDETFWYVYRVIPGGGK